MPDNRIPDPSPAFELGQLVATPNALRSLTREDVIVAIRRHVACDWSEMDQHDQRENARAVQSGGRIFSAFTSANGTRFWVITEADRSVTTVLLPEDY